MLGCLDDGKDSDIDPETKMKRVYNYKDTHLHHLTESLYPLWTLSNICCDEVYLIRCNEWPCP